MGDCSQARRTFLKIKTATGTWPAPPGAEKRKLATNPPRASSMCRSRTLIEFADLAAANRFLDQVLAALDRYLAEAQP